MQNDLTQSNSDLIILHPLHLQNLVNDNINKPDLDDESPCSDISTIEKTKRHDLYQAIFSPNVGDLPILTIPLSGGCQSEANQPVTELYNQGSHPKFMMHPGKQQERDHLNKGMRLFISNIK